MKGSVASALALVLASCDEAPTAPPFTFAEATASSGFTHRPTSGAEHPQRIVEVKGGGLALLDLENDGDLDVFVPNGATLEAPDRGPGARLFENVGELEFREVDNGGAPSFRRWGMGVAVGDVDADGYDDVFVSVFGQDALLTNTPDPRRAGARALVEDSTAGVGDRGWSTGCAFGDLDRDGDLDLYVARYLELDLDAPPGRMQFLGVDVFEGPMGLPPQADRLYENLGDGSFRDVTASSGCAAAPASYGLGVLLLDLDGDGLQDVFVGNDSMRNFLFHNRGGLAFEERAVESGLAVSLDGHPQATMGIAVADVSGNGRPDLFTTNFSSDTNTLHVNRQARVPGTSAPGTSAPGTSAPGTSTPGPPQLLFSDRTQFYGLALVSRPFLGWAAAFVDLDHDGDEDLLCFNGHVYSEAVTDQLGEQRAQLPLLFARDGKRFGRVPAAAARWLALPHCDRGAVFGDLDRDGDIDVLVSELGGRVRVLRNDGAASRSSVVVALDDPSCANRRGLGAELVLETDRGTHVRWIYSGGSYLSASAPEAHFGLAPGERPQALVVRWPTGAPQRAELHGTGHMTFHRTHALVNQAPTAPSSNRAARSESTRYR